MLAKKLSKGFALLYEPIDAQLTIHYHNYNGNFKKDFTKCFYGNKYTRDNLIVMNSLIDYYTADVICSFIEEYKL